MKFSTAVFGLLSAVPYLAQGFVLPGIDTTGVTAARDNNNNSTSSLVVHESRLLSKREDDDEWLMVIYNGGKKGEQCGGGSPNEFHQKGSICQRIEGLAGAICADLKLNLELGYQKCEFNFKLPGDNCGGEVVKKVTVQRGKGEDGVDLNDQVKFVSVTCS
ncbi:hypothetical protein PG984_014470 [Apiospora sp. TS-2023a]